MPPASTPSTGSKPLICIVSGSAFTGALVSAARDAELMRDKASFILVTGSKSSAPNKLLAQFDDIIELPPVTLQKSLRSLVLFLPASLRWGRRLRRLLSERGCTRVQSNGFNQAHGAALRLAGFRGQIVTWVRMDPLRLRQPMRSMYLALARWSSDELVAVSQAVRARLPASARVRVIYDPVPDVPVLGASRELNLVFLGNFSLEKGQHHAVAAFHRIADKHPTARLLFFGGVTEDEQNQAYAARVREDAATGAGACRIDFTGFVANPSEAFSEARAALNLSRSEGFSLTCQEASAHGIPVIATRCGGPEEIIDDGKTGYLVPPGDIAEIADRMDRLLSDFELAKQMGEAGAALVRDRFSAESARNHLQQLFGI